jgi:hypothetical protein
MGYDSAPPFRNGRIHILSERCSTCVFRPGNLVRLRPGRMKDLVESNRKADTAFACHQTLWEEGVDRAICRGYFDAYWQAITPLRMAVALSMITEQDPPPGKDHTAGVVAVERMITPAEAGR